MSADSVDSDQYVDGSIDLIHMSADSVDSDQYVDGSIDNEHLADDAVGVDELSATGTASATTFLRGDNAWAEAGGGKVLQVKYIDWAFPTTSDSTTYSYILSGTGVDLVLAITPSSSTSIIVTQLTLFTRVVPAGTQNRGRTKIDWDIGGAGYNNVKAFGYVGGYQISNAAVLNDQASYMFHKVSGTTSEITTKIAIAKFSATSGAFTINEDYLAGSSLQIMEVEP